MTYVDTADFYLIIQPTQLNQLIGSNSNALDIAVEMAKEEVKTYLVQRYKIDEEYALTGSARNLQVRLSIVDISLYTLHTRIAPNNIPELRQTRYDNTIAWLKGCATGKITPSLEEVDISTTGARIRFGGDPKEPNKY